MVKDTSVIVEKIYPLVEKSLDKNSAAVKKCIGNFITSRHSELYDNAPYHRIYFGKEELDAFYKAIKISEQEVLNHLQNAFFWGISYNPPQIKEPFTCLVLMCIRYYIKKNKSKDAEICAIYLAFSGKFYASVHGQMFPKFPPSEHREIMEYVINNKLSERFDLRKEGSVFGAIRSLCITWLNAYEKTLKGKITDDECGLIIQQLRDREKSFMKNIAGPYYEAYENKEYLNYETDSEDDGNFHIVDNDSLKADTYTEKALNYITTNSVDFKICSKYCADQNVKAIEIKDIMEAVLYNKDNMDDIRTVLNILITDFMKNNRGKEIYSMDFVSYSIKTKPNTKDPDLLRMKSIILSWLDENSPAYRKRKNRPGTASSYYKAILQYFVLIINKVAR